MIRKRMNKAAGARKFRKQIGKTKAANLAPPPQRGGYRW